MGHNYQPGRAWFITILLGLFMLINFVDKVGIGFVAVPMITELNLTPTQFGVISGSFFWFFAISGILGGFLANRLPSKWLLLIFVLIWSIAQLPLILSSSIAMIIASRVILGIGEGPASPVSFHACYKWFPDAKRNLPISVINQFSAMGLLVAGILIPLITMRWGWRANFLIMAGVGPAWALAWLVWGAEGQVDAARPAKAVGRKEGMTQYIPYGVLLRDPTVLGIFIMHFVAFWGLALALTWLPAYLQKGLGYDAVTSGRLFALVVLINAPVNLLLSWQSQRMLNRGASSRGGRAIVCGIALITAGALFVSLFIVLYRSIQQYAKGARASRCFRAHAGDLFIRRCDDGGRVADQPTRRDARHRKLFRVVGWRRRAGCDGHLHRERRRRRRHLSRASRSAVPY
jgi:MFS family permease